MTNALEARIARDLQREVHPAVASFGARLGEACGAIAVLFYGSNLRTGALDGVLDYYLLMPGAAERGIWPTVSYHEWNHDGQDLRAKVATVTLEKFTQAASGALMDTTIWARFVQPSALIWSNGEQVRAKVISAIAAAARVAARLGAVLGPIRGTEAQYWNALFEATYKAEFRVENQSRAQSLIDLNRNHFEGLLPLALAADGIAMDRNGDEFAPQLAPGSRSSVRRWWARRRILGKPLNLLRLVRAASTFAGAARYAAWKIERHTGVTVDMTPWREKHPLLAAPGVLLAVRKAQRRKRRAEP